MRQVNLLLYTFYIALAATTPAIFALVSGSSTLFLALIASSGLPIPFGFLGPEMTGFDVLATFVFSCMLALLALLLVCAYIISLTRSFESLAADLATDDVEALFKKMRRVKIGFVPFWALCAMLAVFYLNNNVSYFILLHIVGALYIHLICTSRFSLAYLRLLRRNGTIGEKQFAVHVVLQFLFIVDIASTIVLVKQHGKSGGTHRSPRSP